MKLHQLKNIDIGQSRAPCYVWQNLRQPVYKFAKYSEITSIQLTHFSSKRFVWESVLILFILKRYRRGRLIGNKTGTSQVGAISKAQIKSKGGGSLWRQKISRKSHTVPKKPKGVPFTLIRFCRLRLKKPKGTHWGQKKFSKKVAQGRNKNRKGRSLVPSGFVGYV